MTIGFECEYFLGTKYGLVHPVPRRYPRDGTQNLVEVRSTWYRSPLDTLDSFLAEHTRLTKLVERDGYMLINLPAAALGNKVETAGFHIHFSTPVTPQHIAQLDAVFGVHVLSMSRKFGWFRRKPHGFEYRSLSATVSPREVAELLLKVITQ